MFPFFPSLRPTVCSSICVEADIPCDDETELREMEKEHVAWVYNKTFLTKSIVSYQM